jgi:hypothetical protein
MQKPNDQFYYYNSIKNSVVIFMSLFKNMKVVDTAIDDAGTLTTTTETPIDIAFAPKERKYYELTYEATHPKTNVVLSQKVPSFSVSINSINYDSSRALNFFRTRRIKQNASQYNDRMPTPYNIGITLDMNTKYDTHLFQIVENIVPFMNPYIIVRVKENLSYLPDVPRELKIETDGTFNRDITLEWAQTERRFVTASMVFTLRSWVYRPLSEAPGPILHIPITFFSKDDFDLDHSLLDYTEVVGPNWGGSLQ